MNDRNKTLDAASLLAAVVVIGATAPVTAQMRPVATKSISVAPISKSITFKGSEAQARTQAASLRASDPIKSQLLDGALAAAKVRPGFNPAAVSIGIQFTMKTGATSLR
ncbi:hypothetical protein ACVWZA_003375 [Sphingomonas sp. UYAg733]